MAAKVNRFLVATCLLCYLATISLCQNDTTNITDVNSTTVTTTVPTTTTTTIPTTTTTALPALPSSAVPANVDIGQCPCDLTGNGCDVNCLCDSDCSADDLAAFSEYLPSSTSVDDRLCVQSQIMLIDNSVYTTETTQDGLFCIVRDNYAERNYYSIPDLVSDTTTFNNYLSSYAGTTYMPSTFSSTTYSQFYRYDDPVYVVFDTLATGYLTAPQAMASTYCADGNPVAFLKEQKFECLRRLTTLDSNTCVNTAYLSASTYYTRFRVVTSPYLFSDILNSTSVTTAAPLTTTTTTTTAAPTTAASTNATDTNITSTEPTTTTTVTTTVTTTTGNITADATSSNVTEGNITSTTEAVTTVITTEASPSFVDVYNNSYTIDVTVDQVQCKSTSGIVVDCGFGSVAPDPTFNGTHCENVVVAVEYSLTQDGSNGITQATVSFILDTVDSASLPLAQSFSTKFPGVNEVNVTERSGNPGYIVGKPVRAGVLQQNTTEENRWAIVESQYDLTMVKSSATGQCLTDANNRVQVNFGENVKTGCLIRFNLENINNTDYCRFMQESIIDALEGMNDTEIRDNVNNFRRVAIFGNSAALVAGDWVQILREQVPDVAASRSRDLIDGPVCSLSLGMHIEILYAKVGALANPQAKIIGVAFKYEARQDVTYTCVGTYCTPGNSLVDQSFEVSQSVTFIDVSQEATGYVGEPPIFLAKVPYDFFYPFVSNSAKSLMSSNITFIYILLFLYKSISMVSL